MWVEIIKKDAPRYESRVMYCLGQFTVSKKEPMAVRHIFNMEKGNRFVEPIHSMMESLGTLCEVLRRGDYATKFDVESALLHGRRNTTSGPRLFSDEVAGEEARSPPCHSVTKRRTALFTCRCAQRAHRRSRNSPGDLPGRPPASDIVLA